MLKVGLNGPYVINSYRKLSTGYVM